MKEKIRRINNGAVITEKNSPDLSKGTTFLPDGNDDDAAVEIMAKNTKLMFIGGCVMLAVSGICVAAYFLDEGIREFMDLMFDGGFQIEHLFAIMFPVGFLCAALYLLYNSVTFQNAVRNGKRIYYRFEATGKRRISGGEDDDPTYYVCFADVMCETDSADYHNYKDMMPVYCVVIGYNGKEYFWCFGLKIFNGKY